MAAKVRQFPRGIPGSMWWGAGAVALVLGAAAFGLDRLGRVLARQLIGGTAGGPTISWAVAAVVMLVIMIAPVLLWAGFSARVVRRWWMTALLTSTAVLLAFPATLIAVEVGNPRPMLYYSMDAVDRDWVGVTASVLISFLAGALVHGACRWLLIRPQTFPSERCWRCGYSRSGIADEGRCPECGSSRTANLSRSAVLIMGKFGRVMLPLMVLVAAAVPIASVSINYLTGTRPALAILRGFGERELIQATSISDWTTGEGFVGVGALRRLDDRHMLVLAIPEERMSSLFGQGGADPAGQLFVVQLPTNGWAMRGGAWSGESEWDPEAFADLNGHQLTKLSTGVPPEFIGEFRAAAQPSSPGVQRKPRRIDPRPWLGD